MNILFLTPGFPKDETDYRLSFLYLEVKHLIRRKDIKIIVFSNDDSKIINENLTIIKAKFTKNIILLLLSLFKFLLTIKKHQIHYIQELFHNPKNFLINNYFEMQARKVIKKFNIEIIHTHFAVPSGYCGNLSNKFRLPLFVNLRGVDINIKEEFNYGMRRDKNYERRLIISLKNASRIIVQSRSFYQKVIDLIPDIEKNKILIFPNGVEISKNLVTAKKNTGKKINVLFVGALLKRKGLQYIIYSAIELGELIDNFKFSIIGEGDDETYFKDLVKENNLENYFYFIGKVHTSSMKQYYNDCDVLVHPTLAESFGNVLVEAMLYKKPVIGFNIDGVPDIIEENKTGFLIEPKNYKQMAEKLKHFYLHPNHMIEMGEKAYEKVLREFDINLKVSRYYDLYKSLLQEKKLS